MLDKDNKKSELSITWYC